MPEPNSGCWLWLGSLNDEYGIIYFEPQPRFRRRSTRIHRYMFEIDRGQPFPLELISDHLCCVKCCCNPNHIEAVTRGENARRGGINNRRTSRAFTEQLG